MENILILVHFHFIRFLLREKEYNSIIHNKDRDIEQMKLRYEIISKGSMPVFLKKGRVKIHFRLGSVAVLVLEIPSNPSLDKTPVK